MKPSEVRKINAKARRIRRTAHVHRPVRVRNEGGDVVGAFCPCGALFNRKMRPAMSASRRQKIVEQMERIRDEAEDE